jgi:hypothetical protein
MPTQKDLKRLVRARMQKTGESYTAARARLLQKRKPAPNPAKEKPAPPIPKADLAAVAGMSDAAVAQKTGRDWKEWVSVLDRAGSAAKPHREIARWLADEGVPSWWAQMVTVGYERIRGLRERGQRRDGRFDVSKSKVYPVPVEELWKGFMRCKEWLDGEKLRMSTARKHKSMRMKWSDGTPVDAMFFAKGPKKSQLALQHSNLPTRAEATRLRTYWGERFERIAALLRANER